VYWRLRSGSWIARRPESFTEKVQWKMLKDRRPLLTTFADKIAARDYVASVVGAGVLTQCYAVVADVRQLKRQLLPREFVAKVSHGSGGVWIVADQAPAQARVVTEGGTVALQAQSAASGWNWIVSRPDEFDWEVFVSTFTTWRGWNYAERGFEWAYLDVRPRILVEELLRAGNGEVPSDYKIFVFNGRARLVQVDQDRFGEHRRNLYLPDWTPVDVEYTYRRAEVEAAPPRSLGRMLEIAEALGRETDFVRVDLFDLDGRVVFGELTNYPGAGTEAFVPARFDEELGRWWKLPRTYS
jgi:hypothetical protein